MSDEVDDAQVNIERDMAYSLQEVARKALTLEVNATGSCLLCGEPVAIPRRWCDSTCRDEWER